MESGETGWVDQGAAGAFRDCGDGIVACVNPSVRDGEWFAEAQARGPLHFGQVAVHGFKEKATAKAKADDLAATFRRALVPGEADYDRLRLDAAQVDRDFAVAALARAVVALGGRAQRSRVTDSGWREDLRGCVQIDLPTGRVAWCYSDAQAALFEWLPEAAMDWEGYGTPEAFERLKAFALAPGSALAPVALGGEWAQMGRYDWQRDYADGLLGKVDLLRNGACRAELEYGFGYATGPARFWNLKDLETAQAVCDRWAAHLWEMAALFGGAGRGGAP